METGSIAAAARSLGYSASAVSQQIASLEQRYNVVLFDRGARTIRATAAAARMAKHARKVVADVDAMAAAVHEPDFAEGVELRIGMFPSLATYVLPEILTDGSWKKALTLRLRVAEPGFLLPGLMPEGDLDLALVYEVGRGTFAWPHNVQRQWLGEDHFHVIVPPAWGFANNAQLSPEQLDGRPWILHHPGTPDATLMERMLITAGISPRVVALCDDFTAGLSMAAAGLGALLVPELILGAATLPYVSVTVPELQLSRSIHALTPAHPARTEQVQDERKLGLNLFLDKVQTDLSRRSEQSTP